MTSPFARFAGPQYYDDCLGPLWFDLFAADLVRRLPAHPPGDALEIACGTGLVTRRLREWLEPPVRVVATDVSAAMLDFARGKPDMPAGIEWREADAMKLPFADREFGAVICGFGMMFMPDRQAALREARRVLTEGGILLFDVWDRIELNPHAAAIAEILAAMFPGEPVASFTIPYDMGEPTELRALLEAAGFGAVRIETKRIAVSGADPRRIATGQIRGTPRAALIEQSGVSPDAVIDRVTDALTMKGGNPYQGHAQAVVVQAVAV